MLMDVKLLPLVELANKGDVDAIREIAFAYIHKKGVKEDKYRQKFYLLELLKRPEFLSIEEKGYLPSLLGDLCFNLREYEEAADWYIKAIGYFLENLPPDKTKEWFDILKPEQGLCDAFYWDIRSKELAMESPD